VHSVYEKADGAAYRKIADEAIIIPIASAGGGTSDLFRLTGIGQFIWESIDGERNADELLKMVLAEYSVSEEQARTDLDTFLDQLKSHNLIGERH